MLRVRDHSRILAVSSTDAGLRNLKAIGCRRGWKVEYAGNCQEAWMALHRRGADVIVTDADFPDGLSWKDLVEEVAGMPAAPPVIVVSPIRGDELRADVLGAGAFGLLVEPLDPSEFVRAVDLALQQSRGGQRARTACANHRRNLPRPAFQPGLEPARNAAD